MKWLPLIIFIFLFLSCNSKGLLPIQFYKEEVFIKLAPKEVYVKGIYYFKNRTEAAKRMKLFYPFPIDSLHKFPYNIEVENAPFDTAMNGITYDVVIGPMDTTVSTVRYRQEIDTNNARYILTTARKWKEPIREARFIINLPEQFRQVSITYQPDSVEKKGGRIFYYINEFNLFPRKDIDILWGSPE